MWESATELQRGGGGLIVTNAVISGIESYLPIGFSPSPDAAAENDRAVEDMWGFAQNVNVLYSRWWVQSNIIDALGDVGGRSSPLLTGDVQNRIAKIDDKARYNKEYIKWYLSEVFARDYDAGERMHPRRLRFRLWARGRLLPRE